MTNVAEELALPSENVTKDHVIQRVEDWKQRISALYREVRTWLPDDVTSDTNGAVPMYEDMMRQFGVQATTLPVLTLSRQQAWLGKLVPQGLWIFGANGRIDLFAPKGQAIIVDRSENFGQPAWLIAPSDRRRNTVALDADTFRAALGL